VNNHINRTLADIATTLVFNDCTITTARRGSAYAAGDVEIVITHTPTGDTVKLPELTAETIKDVLE